MSRQKRVNLWWRINVECCEGCGEFYNPNNQNAKCPHEIFDVEGGW